VPYWDVAPVLIGVNVIVAALSPRLAWTIAYLVATLVFGWLVVYLNRRAVRGYFVPLRDEIERILREES
jgi:small-conductance mechanosensitive channel